MKTCFPLGFSIVFLAVLITISTVKATEWHDVETWSFNLGQYSDVTITVSGSGTTNPSAGNYPSTYWVGDTLQVTAFPSGGWKYKHMKRNGVVWTAANPGTFLNLASTETINVVFEAKTWCDVETWSFDLYTPPAPEQWNTVETWTFHLQTPPPAWHRVETWTFDLVSSARWWNVENWTVNLVIGGWNNVENWTLNLTPPVYPYNYYFYGVYSEDSAARNGNITVTVYPLYGTCYNFTLDGNHSVNTENKPAHFRFWLENNMSRYFTPMYAIEEIYVFKPTDPYYVYMVDFIDLLGVTDAYLESYITANATVYPIERRRVQAGMQIPFVLTFGREYGFRIYCDQGTYDFGRYIPAADQTITLTITPLSFPTDVISYGNITLSASRMNGTWIQVLYLDAGNHTVLVNATIIMRKGQTSHTEYSTEQATSNSFSLNWYDAETNRDYVARILVNHSDYGVLTWSLPCSRLSAGENPWDFSWMGVFPFDSTQLVGFVLVMIVFASFSAKDAHIGFLLGVAVAALMVMLGWLAIGWTSITVMFCLGIMYALTRRRTN